MIHLELSEGAKGILAKRVNTLIKIDRKEGKKKTRTFLIGQLNYYILQGVPVDEEEAKK